MARQVGSVHHSIFSRNLSSLLTNHSSDNKSYVAKPVKKYLYDQAFRLCEDLKLCPFVRLPIDGSDADHTLIFQHYTEDFLSFMQSGPVSKLQVKRILSDILKGITAFHSKDWVHCGMVSFVSYLRHY